MTEKTEPKGRPTPKRSVAGKRRSGPVAPPPTNRREAAKALRVKQAENRQRIKDGTARGDETAMLPRDAGPVRRLVRDTVDGRRTLGWLLLPTAGVVFVANFISLTASAVAFNVWVVALLVVGGDMVVTGRRISAVLKLNYPAEKRRPLVIYGLLRTTQFSRFRRPPPTVRPAGRKKS